MPFYGIFNELWTNSCMVNGKSIKEGKFFDLEGDSWGWLWGGFVDIRENSLKLGFDKAFIQSAWFIYKRLCSTISPALPNQNILWTLKSAKSQFSKQFAHQKLVVPISRATIFIYSRLLFINR